MESLDCVLLTLANAQPLTAAECKEIPLCVVENQLTRSTLRTSFVSLRMLPLLFDNQRSGRNWSWSSPKTVGSWCTTHAFTPTTIYKLVLTSNHAISVSITHAFRDEATANRRSSSGNNSW